MIKEKKYYVSDYSELTVYIVKIFLKTDEYIKAKIKIFHNGILHETGIYKLDFKNIEHWRIKELEQKLKQYESGFKGACPTCEAVGELNVELEQKLAEQSELLAKAVDGLKSIHKQILKELEGDK